MSGRRRAILAALCVLVPVVSGVVASPAAAEHIVLGVPIGEVYRDDATCGTLQAPCTFAQLGSSEGAFVAPADGRITEWWAASFTPDTARLRLIERVPPLTQVKYKAVASSELEKINKLDPHYPTDLAVAANEVIALSTSHVARHVMDSTAESREVFAGPFADGTSEVSAANARDASLQYGAAFTYRPVVSGLDDASGPVAGGGTVTITGAHFTESTHVFFGSTLAPSFTIVSNTEITATVPAEAAGAVDVTVEGPGGRSATGSVDRYSFLERTASVDPAVLDFGDEPVGKTSGVRSVTLTNTGKVAVSVASVSLTGPGAGDFTRVSDGCASRDVAGGATCSVKLLFSPSAAGTRRAALQLNDNSTNGPHTVLVIGNGTVPGKTTTTTTTTTTLPPPPVRFSVGRPRGTVLPVSLGAAGVVRVVDAGATLRLMPSSASGGPGTVAVRLHPTSTTAKILRRRRHVTVRVRITFIPRRGRSSAKTVTLVLTRSRR